MLKKSIKVAKTCLPFWPNLRCHGQPECLAKIVMCHVHACRYVTNQHLAVLHWSRANQQHGCLPRSSNSKQFLLHYIIINEIQSPYEAWKFARSCTFFYVMPVCMIVAWGLLQLHYAQEINHQNLELVVCTISRKHSGAVVHINQVDATASVLIQWEWCTAAHKLYSCRQPGEACPHTT